MTKDQKKSEGHCHTHMHPGHAKQLHRLRRAVGQAEGIEKMILDRRYCLDIIQQIHATRSALRSLELAIFKEHLKACVREALTAKDSFAAEEKMDELLELLGRQS